MTPAEATRIVVELHDAWYPYLLRYAIRAGGSVSLAEEAAQETFMALYRALLKGQTLENYRAWTLRVVRRQLGRIRASDDRARMNATALDDLEMQPSAPSEQPSAFEYDELYRVMKLLTPREIEVVMLRLEPLTYGEIARQLGISSPSVGTLLMRAIRKLRSGMAAAPERLVVKRMEDWDEPDTLQ
jgi:RNA polymerase sigma-70 factor (ECF subfamily)